MVFYSSTLSIKGSRSLVTTFVSPFILEGSYEVPSSLDYTQWYTNTFTAFPQDSNSFRSVTTGVEEITDGSLICNGGPSSLWVPLKGCPVSSEAIDNHLTISDDFWEIQGLRRTVVRWRGYVWRDGRFRGCPQRMTSVGSVSRQSVPQDPLHQGCDGQGHDILSSILLHPYPDSQCLSIDHGVDPSLPDTTVASTCSPSPAVLLSKSSVPLLPCVDFLWSFLLNFLIYTQWKRKVWSLSYIRYLVQRNRGDDW